MSNEDKKPFYFGGRLHKREQPKFNEKGEPYCYLMKQYGCTPGLCDMAGIKCAEIEKAKKVKPST